MPKTAFRYYSVTFAQRNARNFTATSNLLDNPYAKSSFIFILFWVVRRGSVGIVHGPFCRVVRGPGLSGGPWTGGSLFSGYPVRETQKAALTVFR